MESFRKEIIAIAKQHGASHLRIFGSVAKGLEGPKSDLDLLVKLAPGSTLLDIVAIKQDLEKLLGCKVDVLTEASLSPYLRDEILKTAVNL